MLTGMKKTALLNNRYQIVTTLARGGFGETFLATDTYLPSGRKCVIKQLKPIIQEPQIPIWMKDRFQQEARILEHLGGENQQIPRLYAYFSEGENFYLVQEWIEGITLTEKVEKEGTLSQAEVEKILVSILPVLDYVHSQRIVHRDLKPDNIILRSRDGLPVLIDFGAVKEAMATAVISDRAPSYSVAIGTPGYMSSEQAAGRPVYSSDLYSLGLTAVYLLTGKSPQYLRTDSRTGEVLWREAAPQIHSNLAAVLDRAIRFHPRDRFSSAQEMLAALQLSPAESAAATVASLGPENISGEITNQKTVVVSHPTIQEEGHNWFKAFLPLLILSVVAAGSFIFGFNVLLERGKTPQPYMSTQPEGQTLPPTDANPYPEEQLETNSTESDSEPIEETPPPKIIVKEVKPPPRPKPAPPTLNPNPVISSTIPIVVTGTSEAELVSKLGQPTSKSRGYWNNSTAWSYKDVIPNKVDLGYIFDKNTGKIRQTEVSFPPSLDLPSMENTLNGLLGGSSPGVVKEALRQVYQRETDLRSFNLGNLRGMIKRNQKDRIYIGVWEENFH